MIGQTISHYRILEKLGGGGMTSSLEALKAYSLGGKARNEKGSAAGLPYHQHAIQLDPNFCSRTSRLW